MNSEKVSRQVIRRELFVQALLRMPTVEKRGTIGVRIDRKLRRSMARAYAKRVWRTKFVQTKVY